VKLYNIELSDEFVKDIDEVYYTHKDFIDKKLNTASQTAKINKHFKTYELIHETLGAIHSGNKLNRWFGELDGLTAIINLQIKSSFNDSVTKELKKFSTKHNDTLKKILNDAHHDEVGKPNIDCSNIYYESKILQFDRTMGKE